MSSKLQRQVIENFKKLSGAMTYREIGEIVEINITRVFRICNGWEMKLGEYEKFAAVIKQESSNDLWERCVKTLSIHEIEEIRKIMKVKLESAMALEKVCK